MQSSIIFTDIIYLHLSIEALVPKKLLPITEITSSRIILIL